MAINPDFFDNPSDSVTIFGSGISDAMLLKQTEAEITSAKSGATVMSVSFITSKANGYALAISETSYQIGDRNPDISTLKLANKSFKFKEAYCLMTLVYEGVLSENIPDPVYELVRGTSQEPIETHPDFLTFAGKHLAEVNGAVFDPETSAFVHFAGQGNTTNATAEKLKGLSAYLVPSAVIRCTQMVKFASADMGSIETPPNAPSISGGKNWLKTSVSYRTLGDWVEVTEEWTSSGKKGWLPEIYS
jgi:hypothetical protein